MPLIGSPDSPNPHYFYTRSAYHWYDVLEMQRLFEFRLERLRGGRYLVYLMKSTIMITLIACLLATTVDARLGESLRQIESRIINTSPRKAVEYDSDAFHAMLGNQAKVEKPYQKLLETLGELGVELDEHYYWKTDRPEKVATSNDIENRPDSGWDYHILLYKGQSAIEFYRRLGKSLDEYELNLLLEVNKSTAWTVVDKRDLPEVRLFDYNYELSDGRLRAVKVRNFGLMIYESALETKAAEKLAKASAAEDGDNRESAPGAVLGF